MAFIFFSFLLSSDDIVSACMGNFDLAGTGRKSQASFVPCTVRRGFLKRWGRAGGICQSMVSLTTERSNDKAGV